MPATAGPDQRAHPQLDLETYLGEEMTTASFTHFVKTMEGQYQVSLGHALAHESVVDGVSRMLPIKDPIIIKRTEQNERAKEYGVFNPNIKNETLSLICTYVRCRPVAASCINTLKPTGHCCDICGGIINFSGIKTKIKNIRDLVSNVIIHNGMTAHIAYSVERIDDNEAVPRYQIALFPQKEYGDQMFKAIIALIDQEMSKQGNNLNYFSVETKYSRKDHSCRTC
uniref:Protein amnionless n=1 Tax=Heterorhabditis bacteriophora TaxID=37862 RepID=A0A1I7WAS5_HETBA